MSVSLKHFVDVNIKQHVASAIVGTRKTVALFTCESGSYNSKIEIQVNASDFQEKCEGMTSTLSYLSSFFNNGGQSAIVYTGYDNLTASDVMSLPTDLICVGYVASTGQNAAVMKIVGSSLEANADFYGINRKILLCNTDSVEDMVGMPACVACKYSWLPGAEMTIAAYLSKINVYDVDSVHDYMYTIEQAASKDLTDEEYESIISKNMNVDIRLANQIRNCGGNMADGSDIVNTYVLIVLHQTLTARLTELLSQKIKSSDGISKIYAVISQELGNYLTCGYLTTDKVWTDGDLVISYNNETYTIIETGTAITEGYVVKVLPFSSLTDNDKAQHKTPPIHIVLASQYGIRAITINGEVI